MIIAGYRKMTGLTQKEVAKRLNISEGTYRKKERGYAYFKENEMKTFLKLVRRKNPSVNVEDIFFNNTPTQKDDTKQKQEVIQ